MHKLKLHINFAIRNDTREDPTTTTALTPTDSPPWTPK